MLKFINCILLLLVLNSCLSRVNKHGYMFDLIDGDQIKPEITSKDALLRVMGTPTLISDLNNDETWIYYSEDIQHFLFFKPDIIDRQILAVKFDNGNIVQKIERYDLSSQKKGFDFSSNETEVASNKIGFFKSIFSNIGQIKPQ